MANISVPVNPGFPEVHQWDIEEDVIGGPDGIATRPIKQLTERTAFLKKTDEDLQQQLEAVKGRGGYLNAKDFGKATPTKAELTAYALEQIGQTDQTKIFNGTHVKNLNNGHVWVLTNTPDTDPPVFEWADDGLDSVGIGTNTGTAGVVSGGTGFDEVFIDPLGKMRVNGLRTFNADMVDGLGRDLMQVILGHGIGDMTTQSLRDEAIAEVMANIRFRGNSNGEIDGSKIPNYTGIADGDILDGLDLSGIVAAPGGNAPQAWNDQYKNNRLVLSGLNPYKSAGNTENAKNHVLFTFRNVICQGRMNATDTNTGGYPATEMRAWLEGAGGDGSGAFATKLKAALGGDFLYTIQKYHSTKASKAWNPHTVFIPSEIEVFGYQSRGDDIASDWTRSGFGVQFPIFQKGYAYIIKYYNGSRAWWWLATPTASSATYFCGANGGGYASSTIASSDTGGVAPAFCVA